jgi:tRNA dimethylallyltransferase
MRPLVAIVGPTGAGKSALALRMCEQFNGEVVNCDSLQLYRGFDIGTAKTSESGRRGIRHHMIDVLEPGQGYSAGEYARCARAIIREITGRARLPVIVGGTGFYLRALLNGLPPLPERDETLRARLAARESNHPQSLHRLLRRLDLDAAKRIHPHDTQKLIRALEIRILTRNPLPPAQSAEALTGYRALHIGLDPDRALLYKTLDARAREMFHSGLIDEVRGLFTRGCTGAEKPFESLGYKQALQYLRGSLDFEQAIESTQLETRQYAKRQLTWFHREPQVQWLAGFGQSIGIVDQCFQYIQNFV